MKNAGFLDKEVAFEDIVDNSYAEAVIAENNKKQTSTIPRIGLKNTKNIGESL